MDTLGMIIGSFKKDKAEKCKNFSAILFYLKNIV